MEETNEIRALILEVRSTEITPRRLSEIASYLASCFANLSAQAEEIEVNYSPAWLELRKGVKSDSMAERLYDATPDGQRRIRLKFQLRYIEKVISSIKDRLKVRNNEAFNQY